MMATADATVRDALAVVLERIATAAHAAGRDASEITLVAVSKTHGPAAVRAAVAAGVTHLGENRVQELLAKAEAADVPATWHLIGPLQSNKAQHVVDKGWWLHGVDRDSLVDRLGRVCEHPDRQAVLVQVNVGEDPAKHGCTVDQAPALVERAVRAGLDVRGLMTIPPLAPAGVDPNDDARRHFAALRTLRDRIAADHPGVTALSMGMSGDLEAAVDQGATHVRVGTAIFGRRGDTAWRPPA